MRYEFQCDCDQKKCQAQRETGSRVVLEIEMRPKDAPTVGTRVSCPLKTCKGTVVRIFSKVAATIVKGSTQVEWGPNQTIMSRVGGQDIPITFIDHPHTDPNYQKNFAKLCSKGGVTPSKGISNAYYSEKHGRFVVDVVSDRPDPLGAVAKASRNCDTEAAPKKVVVNSPFQMRKKAEAARAKK